MKKIMKIKEEEDFCDMHMVWETNKESTTTIYSNITCKMGKDWDFSWNLIYHLFEKEDYFKFPFDEGFKEQTMDVYLNISNWFISIIFFMWLSSSFAWSWFWMRIWPRTSSGWIWSYCRCISQHHCTQYTTWVLYIPNLGPFWYIGCRWI